MPAITSRTNGNPAGVTVPPAPKKEMPKREEVMEMIEDCGYKVELPSQVDSLSGYELEPATAKALEDNFAPFFQKARYWKEKAEAIVVLDESETDKMKVARDMRLAIRNIRLDADKLRKRLKLDGLRYGKAVQGVYNVIEYMLDPIETHLREQENFAEIREQKKRAELAFKREAEIAPYVKHTPIWVTGKYGEISEEDYQKILSEAIQADKDEKEAEIRRAEAEEAEKQRAIKEAEARSAEAEEKQKIAEAQRAEEEKKRRKAEASAKAQEAVWKAEREEKERELQKAREAMLEAEKKRMEAEKSKRAPVVASEKKKIIWVASELKDLKGKVPEVSTEEGKKVTANISLLLTKLINYIEESVTILK